MNPFEELMRPLTPVINALLERLLRFYQERLAEITRLYEAQMARFSTEAERVAREQSERIVSRTVHAIGHELWELICLNVVISIGIGIVLAVVLFFYIRYRWRKFRWEARMLKEAQHQNDLTREVRDLLREQLGKGKLP